MNGGSRDWKGAAAWGAAMGLGLLLGCSEAPSKVQSPGISGVRRHGPMDCQWFPIFPDEQGDKSLEGSIYHQGLLQAPSLLQKAPLKLPLHEDHLEEKLVIVKAVLSRDGHVLRACLLRIPNSLLQNREMVEEGLARTLREYRYRPALLEGQPVAVYYNITLPIEPE